MVRVISLEHLMVQATGKWNQKEQNWAWLTGLLNLLAGRTVSKMEISKSMVVMKLED